MLIISPFIFQAFSVFFVCLSLTADFLCFLFIPVQWLFFVAPAYVWIQYVWHTGKPARVLNCLISTYQYFMGCLTKQNREGVLPADSMPVGAVHLRRGVNTVKRSETLPSTPRSLPAIRGTLYRLSRRHVGL